MHFAMTYRKALGSGGMFVIGQVLNEFIYSHCLWCFLLVVLYSDRRRNHIKSLDEYYHIRASITSERITEEILEQSKKKIINSSSSLTFFLVFALMTIWVALIFSITSGCDILHISTELIVLPLNIVTSVILKTTHLPVTMFAALQRLWLSINKKHMKHSCVANHFRGVAFVGKFNTVPSQKFVPLQ